MAEIRLCGMVSPFAGSGPSVECFRARIKKRDWPGGGTTDVVELSVGNDTVEIWPVPDPLREMVRHMSEHNSEHK